MYYLALVNMNGTIYRSEANTTVSFTVKSDDFLPINISGLELWFDASDSNTLTISDGNVTLWSDKSPKRHHATASSAPPAPTNTLNELDIIDFGAHVLQEMRKLPNNYGCNKIDHSSWQTLFSVESSNNESILLYQLIKTNDRTTFGNPHSSKVYVNGLQTGIYPTGNFFVMHVYDDTEDNTPFKLGKQDGDKHFLMQNL